MESAEKSGLNVFAGVNGDFFAIGSDYHPTGTTIKNGQLISEGNTKRPFVAFTKDGEMRCYTSMAAADVSELDMAVGGRNMLLDDYVVGNLEMDNDFGYTPHPRTIAGVREDGTMVFVVVDGRQGDYSNGAPLDRCAYIMASLGCMDAINLDGGGSSTMIIEKNGEFKTMNSPSDGSLRRIYNSVLLVPFLASHISHEHGSSVEFLLGSSIKQNHPFQLSVLPIYLHLLSFFSIVISI